MIFKDRIEAAQLLADKLETYKEKEALILARLRHPSLPNVLQHFSQDGQQYLVMEYIGGLNLWEKIKHHDITIE